MALANKAVKVSIAGAVFHDGKEELILWSDVGVWNGLGERVVKGGNKGLEVVIDGGLVSKKFIKEGNGAKVEVRKPVLKLAYFHLCGFKAGGKFETGSTEAATAD